jgi:hypothetical protein
MKTAALRSRTQLRAPTALALALALGGCAARSTHATVPSDLHERPEHGLGLVVLVSIDQLRADMPAPLLSRFGAGGFRKLYEQGVSYDATHYAHSATETAVGHATLATGALPRDHGIVGNEWSERGLKVYSADDKTQELLGAGGTGKSAERLISETVGDVLARERPKALVYSVSLKERAATFLQGHKGTAYWLDEHAGAFITSRYYAERLPAWVQSFARTRPLDRYRQVRWELFERESAYLAADDHAWESRACRGAPCLFPHAFQGTGAQLVHDVVTSPFGDELTLAFTRALMENEPLGRDAEPDLLSIGFSSTDYVGHAFGPESREAEDNLLRLDRTLAQLFSLLEERVGRGRFVVVVSADHGACESPEHFAAQGMDAGRIDPNALRELVDRGLRERFNIGVELVASFINPALVLHEQRIASLSLDLAEVERAAAEIALSAPGIHAAFARTDLLAGSAPEHPFKQRIEQSTHPERSGHVYIVPKEHWLLATRPEQLTAMHGTPWPYDAHVPLIVWGTGVAAARIQRPVDPRDIAPTLARLLNIPLPNAATGKVLVEALP